MNESRSQPLKNRTLILFGLPEYAVYLASIPVGLYLPFVYSKDLGLSLTEVGLILMLARISDVITDPLIGYLSDRTPGRFGRRKPWLAGGALLMMISAFQLFNPAVLNDMPIGNIHLLAWAVLLWLGWTMINIPYYAWGAELSGDYHERTRITGWRQAFGFLGNVSVLAVPVMAGEMTGYGSLPIEGLTIIGSMALVALPLRHPLAGAGAPGIPETQGTNPPECADHVRQWFVHAAVLRVHVDVIGNGLGLGDIHAVCQLRDPG